MFLDESFIDRVAQDDKILVNGFETFDYSFSIKTNNVVESLEFRGVLHRYAEFLQLF